MAGIITHIAIADKITDMLGDKIKNVPLFFGGNIAPDCIHSRVQYVRSMKKHTHLRDDIRDADFINADSQALFHGRLDEFVERYCVRADAEFDLYCGYFSHLVTDELFIKTIRQDFVLEMEKQDIKQSDKSFFEFITSDLFDIDNRLAQEYHFKNAPKQTLWAAKDYEVRDYLTADEINNSKGWITNWFDNKNKLSEPKYISYQRIIDFIDNASQEIVKRLYEYKLY